MGMPERRSWEPNRDDDELSGFFEADEVEGEALKVPRRNQRRDWPPGGPRQVFIKRWIQRAALRRIKLIEELLLTSVGPRRLQKLELLLLNLEARKAWLHARLENTIGLEIIVRAALERHSPDRRGPNEARGTNARQEGNPGAGQP